MADNDKISEDELKALKGKAEERDVYYNKWLSVHAEYENTRKRLEKERVDHFKFANEALIAQFFPIMDHFDLALAAMEKAEDKAAVMEGIRLVQKEFHKILEDNGIEKIDTKDKHFDPHVHEAVMAVEAKDSPDGSVIEEVRTGYLLNGRLLRAAQVKVARNERG